MKSRVVLTILFTLLCSNVLFAKAKVVRLTCKDMETIVIRPGRATILNFPVKPRKVVKGSRAFDIQYIENDLAITALKYPATSNIFVYLQGRRYGFILKTAHTGRFDEVVIVRDLVKEGEKVKVKFKDE